MKLLGKRIVFEPQEITKSTKSSFIVIEEEATNMIQGKVIDVGHEVNPSIKTILLLRNEAREIEWKGRKLCITFADCVIAYE